MCICVAQLCDCFAHLYDCFTKLILMLTQYSDFRFCLNLTLNLSVTESVLYKSDTLNNAVIQGYGICEYASAIFLLRIKILFFDVHKVMKPVGGAKIP